MKLIHIYTHIRQNLLYAGVFVVLVAGCSTLGPGAIKSGHLEYIFE